MQAWPSGRDLPTVSVSPHRAKAQFMVRLGSSMCEVERACRREGDRVDGIVRE
jgi:hypothetical protein